MALRYDGRVAIVTGAGNGLGREYAKLLSSRGAKVVVNDLGGGISGTGSSSKAADDVVAEINADGGEAVANYDSVTDGEKIVQTAIAAFGRIDIIINNAGILRDVSFRKMSQQDWDLIYQVHSLGPFKVLKAAWPHMEKNQYGRIVNISSPAGLYGNFGQVNYSAMKRAICGFSLAMAAEGKKKNIQVNVIAPIAQSRLVATVMPEDIMKTMSPSNVANFVAYLCHETCPSTGDIFELAGRWIAKMRWQRSEGVVLGENYSVDDVAANFAQICDFGGKNDHPPEEGQVAAVKAMNAAQAKL